MLGSSGQFKSAFGTLKQGLASAVNAASQVAAVVAEEGKAALANNSPLLRDYKIGAPVATCGPLDIWAIYSGTCKKPGAVQKDVSIWILDKRRLLESNKHTSSKPKAFDLLFEQQRKSAQNMMRLKHPGVVKVIEPLDDNSQQMVLVTEPITGSLKNVLTHFNGVPDASEESRAMSLSSLALKQGLVHVADTLTFLHNEARISHCGLSTQVIMITGEGVWKLAGFAFALTAATAATAAEYHYSDPFPPLWDELTKPLLPYVAPEQVSEFGRTGSIGPAADVWSLATVVYELLSDGSQLLPVRNSVQEYKAKAAVLAHGSAGPDPFASIPPALIGLLRMMLATSPAARPAIGALSTCAYFQDDVLLRALRFLDTMLQRDHAQKVAFIKDLSGFWTSIDDDRVLTLRVLPPLIQELRTTESLQPVLLPVVLAMLERVSPAHFMTVILPPLLPVLEAAQGETLGMLLGASGLLAKLMTQEAVGKLLVPLYSRALDCDTAPHVQDACLRTLMTTLPTLDYALLKGQIMPRTYTVCMRTTSAAVRGRALGLMTQAVSRLDKEEAQHMTDTAAQVVSVDRSAATVAHVSQLADALSKQHGVDVTASRLLPLLCPLLVAPSLNPQDFAALHTVVQGMLDRITSRMTGDQAASGPQHAGDTTPHSAPVSWDTPLDQPNHRAKPAQPPAGATTSAGPTSWLTGGAPASSSTPPGLAPWGTQPPASTAHPASTSQLSQSTGAGLAAWSLGAPAHAPAVNSNMSGPAASVYRPPAPVDLFSSNGSGGLTGPSGAGLGGGTGAPGLGSGGIGGPSAGPKPAVDDLFGGLSVHSEQSQPLGGRLSGSHAPLGPRLSKPSPLGGRPSGDWSKGSPRLGGAALGAPGSGAAWGSGNGHGSAGMSSVGGGIGGSLVGMGLGGAPMVPSLQPVNSSDPFASLSNIALTAPPSKPLSTATSGGNSYAGVGGGAAGFGQLAAAPRITALPPPPKATTSVSHPPGAAPSSGVDLLW